MYNTDLPTRAELPSAIKLMQSTILLTRIKLVIFFRSLYALNIPLGGM